MAAEAKSIKSLDTAEDLWALRKEVKDQRNRLEILWKLGIAFYRGRQYTYYSTAMRRITQLPLDDSKPRARTRIVSNQIKPNCNRLVAKLLQNKAQFTASPGNSDSNSIKAARLAESAAEYWWDALDMQRKYRQALTWARVAGQGYMLVTWDKYAGQAFQYFCHPETQEPIPSEMQADYQAALAEHGPEVTQAATRTSYTGDLSIAVHSPLNVWVDPTVEEFGDIRYWGVDQHLDPDEVETRWGVKIKADSVITDADLGAQVSDYDSAKKTVCVVSTLYIRPCPSLPQGRVVTFTQDRTLEDHAWNFPFKHPNIFKFGSTPIPNSVYDSGEVEDAIPLNKELNKTISQALTHRDLTINPKWTVPRNSVQQFNAADEIIQFTPINGMEPKPVTHAPMPPYIRDIMDDLNIRIKECFGLTDASSGHVPQGMESGIAMDLQQEASDASIAPIVEDNEIALGKVFQTCLELARVYYTDERMLEIVGTNGKPQIVAFKGSRIPDTVSIHTEASSSMPRTRAGKLARVMFLKSNNLLPPGSEYKYLDMPDLKGWKQDAMMDEDQAEREHDRIKNGQVLNPVALQEAQGAIATGINPDTGKPFMDAAEVQGFLLQSMLKPLPYENSQAHMAVHSKYMKSVEFEESDPNQQHEFIQHLELTQQKLAAENPEPSQVKVNMAAHEVLPPTAVSAILDKAGVKGITPEILATEEPMESMVMSTDSVDKPNAPGEKLGKTTTGKASSGTSKPSSKASVQRK